ncbi:unnamed protein product [Aureobasidium vineae]|uniref:PNPLA domain-containing protein n=1 Tax=Aureobasidium vineae TaxID=2773715 RepID=A0A9N8PAH5_9PEZI|nr:unnamed protein product [Aureobasidium vineae]
MVYRDLGTKIFAKKQPLYFLGQNKYDYKKLEQFVKDDYRAQRVHMFRSYHNPTQPSDQDRNLFRVNLNDQKDERICEVARATSAAPYYFRSIKVSGLKYLDGGIMANNPSRHAWAEASSMHLNHPSGACPGGEPEGGIRFFVSIGTGKRAEEQIKSGKIRKALSLINKGVQSITETEEAHRWMQATVSNNDIYYRFNVETGLEDMRLDDCRIGQDEHNITYHEIKAAVDDYLQDSEVWARLENLAKRLVDNRRQKCRRQDRGYHGLCVPGPLYRTFDDRFHDGDRDEDVINSPVDPIRTRAGSVRRPANGAHELNTTVQEMPTSASVPELYPQSPPQSPTTWHDTPFQDQQEFSSNGAPRPQPPQAELFNMTLQLFLCMVAYSPAFVRITCSIQRWPHSLDI